MSDKAASMPPTAGMARNESLYLDLARATAALAVILDHSAFRFALPLPLWGHQAVVVFFVLSGYVISYTADTREGSAQTYLVARFSRLWSVLVPALVLTILCDALGHWAGHPEVYDSVHYDHPVIRILASLSFLAESWVSIQPFSNGVVWSLCCEFWYYILFAAWLFVPQRRLRLLALCGLAVVAGFKAILLLPLWLFGVALHRMHRLRTLSTAANVALFAVGGAGIVLVTVARLYNPAIGMVRDAAPPWLFNQLAEARVFWFDWLFGLLVAAHLLGARTVSAWLPMERIAVPVRWCAGVSFAAYLFHEPLLNLCAAVLSPRQGWVGLGLTLLVIAVIAPPVERSKRWWKSRLNEVTAYALQASSPFLKKRTKKLFYR